MCTGGDDDEEVNIPCHTVKGHNSGEGKQTLIGCGGTSDIEEDTTTAFGYEAGPNLTGDHNTLIGHKSGNAVTVGRNNTFLGHLSGGASTSGARNVFIGYEAGYNNAVGSDHTYIGYQAGKEEWGSNGNTFIGARAGQSTNTGQSTFVGSQTGEVDEGVANTFIGATAGRSNSEGENNTFRRLCFWSGQYNRQSECLSRL